MKKEIEINEWIESYLNGDLPVNDIASFQQQLNDDPVFAVEVERHRLLREVISEGAYLKVKNDLNSIHVARIRDRRINRIRGFGFGGILIGIVCVILVPGIKESEIVQPGLNDSAAPGREKIELQNSVDSITISSYSYGTGIVVDDNESVTFNAVKPGFDDSVSGSPAALPFITEPTEDKLPLLNEKPVTRTVKVNGQVSGKSTVAGTVDCSEVNIEGKYYESESCNNIPTGTISFDKSSLTGGTAPYTFSLTGSQYKDTTVFSNLYPGSYTLYVKDAVNCTSQIGIAFIRTIDCTYQAVFAPSRGEIWNVPADPEKSGQLNIFSKLGDLVYSVRFSIHESVVWDGTTLSGQLLPMGIYQFGIRYSDGISFIGNVTIVR